MSTHRAVLPGALLAAFALTSCGFISAGDDPGIIAFRGGAGYWPENSRHALGNAVLQPYDGIHVDIAVTSDGVPVLHEGPFLDHESCTTNLDELLEEGEVRISDYTYEELEDLYRCGEIVDPDYPDADSVRDTLMRWDEAVATLSSNSGYFVIANVVYEKNETLTPDVIAQAVLDQWYLVDPENRWLLAAPDPDMISALDAYAAALGRPGEIQTMLIWPETTTEGVSAGTWLGTEVLQTLGLADVVGSASNANSDGVGLSHHLLDRQMARKLRANDYVVYAYGVDSGMAQSTLNGWPLDGIVTAYPEPAP